MPVPHLQIEQHPDSVVMVHTHFTVIGQQPADGFGPEQTLLYEQRLRENLTCGMA